MNHELSLGAALSLLIAGNTALANTQAEIDQFLKKYQLPGVAAGVLQTQKFELLVSGVRKSGDATPIAPTDRFHLGSCTKAMTATLIALYVEKGKIQWSSTLESVFPEYAAKMHAEMKSVTLEMLTSHRSGVSDSPLFANGAKIWTSLWDPVLDPREGRKQVLQALSSLPPASTPGSAYEYSNSNYMLAGAMLEKVTGKYWEDLIQADLFKPLQMSSCGFGAQADPKALRPDQPWPHTMVSSVISVVTPDFNADNPPTVGPAGTVHCSMEDWAKFARLHLDGFNGKKTPLLSAASFIKLHEAPAGGEYTYGGWLRLDRKWGGGTVLTHSGSNTMNYATVWLTPMKDAAILSATNVGGDSAAEALDRVSASFIKSLP